MDKTSQKKPCSETIRRRRHNASLEKLGLSKTGQYSYKNWKAAKKLAKTSQSQRSISIQSQPQSQTLVETGTSFPLQTCGEADSQDDFTLNEEGSPTLESQSCFSVDSFGGGTLTGSEGGFSMNSFGEGTKTASEEVAGREDQLDLSDDDLEVLDAATAKKSLTAVTAMVAEMYWKYNLTQDAVMSIFRLAEEVGKCLDVSDLPRNFTSFINTIAVEK